MKKSQGFPKSVWTPAKKVPPKPQIESSDYVYTQKFVPSYEEEECHNLWKILQMAYPRIWKCERDMFMDKLAGEKRIASLVLPRQLVQKWRSKRRKEISKSMVTPENYRIWEKQHTYIMNRILNSTTV